MKNTADTDLYRALFDTAPDAMIVVASDGHIRLANPQALRLFGYAEEELIGRPVEMLMPEAARGAHRGHRDGYMQRPRVRPMGAGQELVGQRRDGARFPVEIALSPMGIGSESLFAASIRDISETQRQRQALRRARFDAYVAQIGQRALESPDAENLADKVAAFVLEAMQVVAVGVFLLRAPLRPSLASAVRDGADRGLVDRACAALALDESATPALTELDFETWLQRDEAGDGWADAGIRGGRLVPVLDHNRALGALILLGAEPLTVDRDAEHFLAVVANVLATAALRHHAQEQLAHSQRLEAVGQLTGGIAHDFNNLLTVISGNLQLLEADCADDPSAADSIARALRAVGRGAELTRKLLAFARRQRLSPAAIAPDALLADLGRMLERTLGEAVQVRIGCDTELPAVYADAVQLENALLNLALNARDAMPRGGRRSISASEETLDQPPEGSELPAGRYIRFTVADTGLGMPPDVLARAFEPFFTTKDAGKGSGLGLSMVYGFVKQSGGHLLATSRLGYGTTIDLILPLATNAAMQTGTAPAAGLPRGSGTVLVVEDEAEVRDVAVAFLRGFGYDVLEAGDAQQALQHLRDSAPIALLFSDVVLGD
ncbi:MAG TPA: PAS domain S-box protein, partial [Tahibacter sp.]|nr:PAS domain S-box protein [Tahibacter sp.]